MDYRIPLSPSLKGHDIRVVIAWFTILSALGTKIGEPTMLLRPNSTLLTSEFCDSAETKTENRFFRVLPSTRLGCNGHFPMISQDESHLTCPHDWNVGIAGHPRDKGFVC